MTRKHFQAIADTIRFSPEFHNEKARRLFAWDIARTLSRFNAAFDDARFIDAATKPIRASQPANPFAGLTEADDVVMGQFSRNGR